MEINVLLRESAQLLRKMIAVPSPSFEEETVRDVVADFLSEAGIHYTLLHNNILAANKRFSPEKKTLMLCAHLDTVPPAADYDFDPYNPDYEQVVRVLFAQEESSAEKAGEVSATNAAGKTGTENNSARAAEEVIAGLGANDDGASVAAMIAVFRHFYEAELPINLILVLSTEEERSGKRGMDSVWTVFRESGIGRLDNVPDWAVVGEPTGMKAAVAEKGLLVIDAEAKGVSGHAARDEGVNAIYIALEDIQRLRDFRFERKSPLMGDIRVTVTQITAGTTHNVIPDKCSFVADIRPNEQYTNAEILSMLQGVCRSELKARNLSNRSSATLPDSPLLKAAQAAGIGTFVSPTTSDWMRISCDAVKMGPGDSSRSHHKNEYVTLAELRDGVGTYIKFIESLAALAGRK
ncbi:MAG: M20/M25/M40 family metallo-hydrolase [Bacteroidales bacterium]|nr:M20/M25/M40 family metallo-hydrolase [Bacteroidales bacterium]